NITILNRSAEEMLDLRLDDALGAGISQVLPRIGEVLDDARNSHRPVHHDQIILARRGIERTFNVQINVESRNISAKAQSYVVTIDDITDLVEAQRSTAWSDVARRIAH